MKVRERLARFGPEIVACLLFLALFVRQIATATAETSGRFVYPLDDVYIHMAIAKNLALHGVWGPTREAFVSSSSSPLWVVVLALCDLVVGPRELTALVISGTSALALLVVAGDILRRRAPRLGGPGRALALVGIVALAPLPAVALTGMEHVAHAALYLALVDEAERTLDDGERSLTRVIVLAALACTARYESLFAVVGIVVLFALQRRWRGALAVLAGALGPLVLFGIYCVAHGAYPVPNSLILKGTLTRALLGRGDFPVRPDLFTYDIEVMHVVMLVALATLAALTARGLTGRGQRGFTIVLLGAMLHLVSAQIGWLLRYEAYLLVAMFVFLLVEFVGADRLRRRRPVDRALAAALLAIFAWTTESRFVSSERIAPAACVDRFHEHAEITRFVARYYDHETIVINDLGMLAYFTDARLLDLFGLGNDEPLRMRMAVGGYTAARLDAWARREHARIAIVQQDWVEVAPRVPRTWTRVATMVLPRNVIFYTHHIAFFAIDPAATVELRARLHAFARELPSGNRLEFAP